MSASLVGSEMCIRDRPETGNHVDGQAGRGGDDGERPRTRHADVVGSEAVSYTHLTLPTICSV
eukprot:4468120-Alexandrium_andersonii.AAC.1